MTLKCDVIICLMLVHDSPPPFSASALPSNLSAALAVAGNRTGGASSAASTHRDRPVSGLTPTAAAAAAAAAAAQQQHHYQHQHQAVATALSLAVNDEDDVDDDDDDTFGRVAHVRNGGGGGAVAAGGDEYLELEADLLGPKMGPGVHTLSLHHPRHVTHNPHIDTLPHSSG